MPLMAGSELVRRIKALRPELRIVVASGSSAMESDDFMGLPVSGVLQKPYTTDALLKAIRDALAENVPQQN
jgi:DNA-binding NarL/FixJ family response regulator